MKAIGKNVIVTRQEPEKTSAGGIIFTDNDKAILGQAIAVGEEVKGISIGDQLVVNWHAAIAVKLDTGTYYIANVDNIFAVI